MLSKNSPGEDPNVVSDYGFAVHHLRPVLRGLRHLQRVRIGPLGSVQQYDQLIARLAQLGYPGARLAPD